LQAKAQQENVERLYIPTDRSLWLKLQCVRCKLETDFVDLDPTVEPSQIEGSPAMAQLVIRCKDCRSQGNLCTLVQEKREEMLIHTLTVAVVETKPAYCLDFGSKKDTQPLARIDCRNFEPIAVEVRPDTFAAVAADSGVVFDPVDLSSASGREWYDYDEKESREVSITDLRIQIMQVK
jgi:hypothetical protein